MRLHQKLRMFYLCGWELGLNQWSLAEREKKPQTQLPVGYLRFCAYSAIITDTTIPRASLRSALGYVLLPLRGVP